MENTNTEYRALSKGLRRKAWWKWQVYNQASLSYDRAYVNGWTGGALPALQYLYEGRPEELKAALLRTRDYWLSQETFGTIVFGVYLSMEEKYANGADFDPQTIREVKSSLMGPLSGIGDAIMGSTIRQIMMLFFLSLALEGAVWAPPTFYVLYAIVVNFPLFNLFLEMGYKSGKDAVTKILGTPWLSVLTKTAGLASMMIMGGMTAKYTTFALNYTYTMGESVVNLQEKLDTAIPGVLAIGATFIFYYLVGKKVKYIYLVLGAFVFCLALTLLGLL